ncbi:unnamed protein product, partial [Meganyctiphanes norvegica]
IFMIVSMGACIGHSELVIPSSFMTLDPYAEAQHHHEESHPPGYYKPQVLPQVSHDPPLTYHVVPATPYDLIHQTHQLPHHQPHHQLHFQEAQLIKKYDNYQKPHYKPHHQKLPVISPLVHDKHFLSHNAHTQHLTYKPPKIPNHLIKKTLLDFPKKGYISHKLTPARDDYARSLYFPVSGYNIDSYFHGFPAFGYFDYEPKLHGIGHHRRRRMLDFKEDIDDSEAQHDTYVIPTSQELSKDFTQQRIARSSPNYILTSQNLQDVDDTPSVLTLLPRSPRTSAVFPKPPEQPRLLEARSTNDQNTWLNQ